MRKLLGILGVTLTIGSLAGFIPTAVLLALGSLQLPVAEAMALLGTLFAGAAGGTVLALTGFASGDRAAFEREQKVLQLAAASAGLLTVAEVAAGCKMSVAESKAALEEMCVQGVAEVQIEDNGDIVYEFAGLKRAAEEVKRLAPKVATEAAAVRPASMPTPQVIEPEIVEPTVSSPPAATQTVSPPAHLHAPYGISPYTGLAYSPRRKTVAGLLQIVPALMGLGGVGRIYTGHFLLGIGQLALGPCGGVGIIWSLLDGLFMLTTKRATDAEGRPLRPEQPKLPPKRAV